MTKYWNLYHNPTLENMCAPNFGGLTVSYYPIGIHVVARQRKDRIMELKRDGDGEIVCNLFYVYVVFKNKFCESDGVL